MKKVVFETRVANIMKQNQEDKPQLRKKSGLIDSPRLSKYQTTNRVFKKRNVEKQGKNYFISILLDASQSMDEYIFGDDGSQSKLKWQCAIDSVIKLCDSLKKIPGMHFEIVSFGQYELKLKDYNDPYEPEMLAKMYEDHMENMFYVQYFDYEQNKLIQRLFTKRQEYYKFRQDYYDKYETQCQDNGRYFIGRYFTGGQSNDDTSAVINSYLRSREREGRKLLTVFSDGSPCGINSVITELLYRKEKRQIPVSAKISGDRTYDKFIGSCSNVSSIRALKKAVDFVESQGLQVLGIGIDDDSVEQFYRNRFVISSTEELYDKTAKALSKLFIKD